MTDNATVFVNNHLQFFIYCIWTYVYGHFLTRFHVLGKYHSLVITIKLNVKENVCFVTTLFYVYVCVCVYVCMHLIKSYILFTCVHITVRSD